MKLEDLRAHIDSRFDRVDSRLDRVENKVDDHLVRVSKSEEAIAWLRGHARISTTIFITISLAAVLYALGLKP